MSVNFFVYLELLCMYSPFSELNSKYINPVSKHVFKLYIILPRAYFKHQNQIIVIFELVVYKDTALMRHKFISVEEP
jgi:hypothetical protein